MLASQLINFNHFIDGRGYQGKISEITLPKIKKVMEDFKSGGMVGTSAIFMYSVEKMEMSFVCDEHNKDLLSLFGNKKIQHRFLGAQIHQDGTHKSDKIEIVMSGEFTEIDFGAVKSTEAAKLNMAGICGYFKYIINDKVIIEIDVDNMILIIDGVDLVKDIRESLGR